MARNFGQLIALKDYAKKDELKTINNESIVGVGNIDIPNDVTKEMIAPTYDNTQTYAVGDIVFYNDNLYKCTTAISVAEDFDSNKWTVINIGGELENKVDLTSAQTITGQKTFTSNLGLGSGKKIYIDSNNNLQIDPNGYAVICRGTTKPHNNNIIDLGTSAQKWKDLYLSGSIKDGTNSITVADISNGLYGGYDTNSTTTLRYKTINNISISTDTTFTLATAPANTYPEYKANITNTDNANAITITLPSGTIIKGNVTISSNTFEIPADSSVELNIMNGRALVMNWSV